MCCQHMLWGQKHSLVPNWGLFLAKVPAAVLGTFLPL